MEETMSLKELFQTLKKRVWIIVLATVIVATISAVVSFFVMTPVYQLKTQLLVNQSKSEQQLYNTSEVQTNIQLINTYNVIIKSPAILEKVKKQLNLDLSVEELDQQIQVSSAKDSQVVEISVENSSPATAAKIANTTAKVFKNEISQIMNIDNVKILSNAQVKENIAPVKPQPLLNIFIGIIIGAIIGIIIAFLIEYFDNTLKSEEDIEKVLGVPVMGVVMRIEDIPAPETRAIRSSKSAARVRGESIGS